MKQVMKLYMNKHLGCPGRIHAKLCNVNVCDEHALDCAALIPAIALKAWQQPSNYNKTISGATFYLRLKQCR